MVSGVEARFQYGGVWLACNEEAFAHIRRYILAEPTIAEAVGSSDEGVVVRFISVGMPPVENTSRGAGWLAVIPTIVASVLSGVVWIVGAATIVRWLIWVCA